MASKQTAKKAKSEFEQCCDELKLNSTDEKEVKAEHQESTKIKQTTKSWPIYYNPNKLCKVAKHTIKSKHCSSKIRAKLGAYIPNDCRLSYCCFSKGSNCCSGFDLKQYNKWYSSVLVEMFAAKAFCDKIAAKAILSKVIGIKQFDFSLMIGNMLFWVKTIGQSAFVKATGTSQRTDCMTFAPKIAVKLTQNILFVLDVMNGTGLIGLGFCNLIPEPRRKTKSVKKINGNAMIMIPADNMEHIEMALYVKKNSNISLTNTIKVLLESKNLSDYGNPMVLELLPVAYPDVPASASPYGNTQETQHYHPQYYHEPFEQFEPYHHYGLATEYNNNHNYNSGGYQQNEYYNDGGHTDQFIPDENNKIRMWLENIGLIEHLNVFIQQGFGEKMFALQNVTNADLKEMGIVKMADRKIILAQIQRDFVTASEMNNNANTTASDINIMNQSDENYNFNFSSDPFEQNMYQPQADNISYVREWEQFAPSQQQSTNPHISQQQDTELQDK